MTVKVQRASSLDRSTHRFVSKCDNLFRGVQMLREFAVNCPFVLNLVICSINFVERNK